MAPAKVTTIDFGTFANVIDGQLRNSKNKYCGIDPTTKEPNWDVPVASHDDIEDAVAAGNKAYAKWKKTSWEERTQYLERFREVFSSYQEELTDVLVKETGKPRMFGAMEVKSCADFFNWHANMKEPRLEKTEDDEKIIVNKYIPLGVVVAIAPWNFPLVLVLAKVLPATQMGNTVIVKPSPFTPYSALKMIEIANQVFPPGVVQVLGGDAQLGPALVEHPGVAKISFTGSIATGKKIMAAAAKTLKRVTLELGGNDPCIILPDVDIAIVAPQVAMGAFFNSGQVCVATKRIYIPEQIYKPFIEALAGVTANLKVGPANEEGVMLGPIQNDMQYQRVLGFFADAKSKGYKFAAGTDTVEESRGYFVQPAIIDNPPNDSRIIVEEPFGPIVPCQPYTDLAEVIERANDTTMGLGATIFGSDIGQCQKVAEQLESGSVWINSGPKPTAQGHFGGVKESGIGTEFGTNGILAYANIKAIHTYKSAMKPRS